MIEGIIIIIISLVVLFGAISTLRKLNKIEVNGEKTQGVIFDNETTNTTIEDATVTYPLVRFTTSNQEWITQKSSVSIIPGSYKKGDKVVIVYDRSSPTNFFIKSSS